ncbi:MAG: hypothetical protein GY758_01000 [Fuerstiella sp.]|nr:hypothetical protein [Fuerstiella sp.]
MSRLGDFAFGIIGGNKSDQHQQSTSQISAEQLPYLQNLWGQGQDLANQQMGNIGQESMRLSGGLFNQGQGFMSQMGSGAAQGLNQYQGPGYAQQQIGALGQLSQNYLGQALQGINSGAIGAGGLGGQRNQLMQGTAIGDATRGFQSAASNLMQQDLGRQQQAGIAQAGIQGQTAMAGMGQLGNMYDLSMSPFTAQWSPLQQQGSLIGGPAMTSQSTGYNQGWGTQGAMSAYGNMWGGGGGSMGGSSGSSG